MRKIDRGARARSTTSSSSICRAGKAHGGRSGSESERREDGSAEERVTINKEFESFDAFIQEYVTNISRTGVFVRATDAAPGRDEGEPPVHRVIMDDIETIEGVGEVVARAGRSREDGRRSSRELSGYSQGLIDKLLTSQGTAPRRAKQRGVGDVHRGLSRRSGSSAAGSGSRGPRARRGEPRGR